ncbi:uncharacterized protein LOC144710662 [Wolffia australiana]
MGFLAFVGRVLFASVFLLSAVQEFSEFGTDGGHAAKVFKPKLDVLSNHLHAHSGIVVPGIEIKNVIAFTLALKGLGSLLFIFGSSLGASLLVLYLAIITPILNDFYNHLDKPEFGQLFIKFTQNLALFGALLFFLGMKESPVRKAGKKKATKVKSG